MPRPSPPPSRRQLLQALDEAVRKVSAQSVLISDLVASRVGLNPTDLECLDLVCLTGPTTAGRIAERTGLTTGATTALIDRLERAGFVTRRRHPDDRRVVVIEVVPQHVSVIGPLYAPLVAAFATLHRHYDDRELATCLDYLGRAIAAGAKHVSWLQTQLPVGRTRRRHVSPGPLHQPAATSTRPRGNVARAAPSLEGSLPPTRPGRQEPSRRTAPGDPPAGHSNLRHARRRRKTP